MIKCDLHVHTNFCDGKKSPEEVVKKAIELNMEKLGLLVHSYTFFDESYFYNTDIPFQNGLKQIEHTKYYLEKILYCYRSRREGGITWHKHRLLSKKNNKENES